MEVERMQELRTNGASYRTIAKEAGITRQRVHQKLSGYGDLNKQLSQNGRYSITHQSIIERDGGKCTECGNSEDLIVHHRDGNDRNNAEENLITLCRQCHVKGHKISPHSDYARKVVNWRLRADLLERLEAEANQKGLRSVAPLVEDILCGY